MKYTITPLSPEADTELQVGAALAIYGVTHLVEFESNMINGKFVGFILRDIFGSPGRPGARITNPDNEVRWAPIMGEPTKCVITNPAAFNSCWIEWKLTHVE